MIKWTRYQIENSDKIKLTNKILNLTYEYKLLVEVEKKIDNFFTDKVQFKNYFNIEGFKK
jgi:hypothetical protein